MASCILCITHSCGCQIAAVKLQLSREQETIKLGWKGTVMYISGTICQSSRLGEVSGFPKIVGLCGFQRASSRTNCFKVWLRHSKSCRRLKSHLIPCLECAWYNFWTFKSPNLHQTQGRTPNRRWLHFCWSTRGGPRSSSLHGIVSCSIRIATTCQ